MSKDMEMALACLQEAVDEELERMFSPASPSIQCLIARQIIKEHDAHCGMPGLRLYAEGGDSDFSIVFTLKRA